MAYIHAAFRATKHMKNQLNTSLSLCHFNLTVLTAESKTRELDTL